MEGSSGVKKGAWSKEEDELLRACVQQHGEGKWHLVPKRTGLNRCRKSCRLRWLNYLKPDIKRGEFTDDEIDLMIRLHKLLGNRWSLIAGRLPGRTSNDVKNYWNTHIRKKLTYQNEDINARSKEMVMEPDVLIKPQPQKISTKLPLRYSGDQNGGKQCITNQAYFATTSECIKVNETCYFGEPDWMLLEDLNMDQCWSDVPFDINLWES